MAASASRMLSWPPLNGYFHGRCNVPLRMNNKGFFGVQCWNDGAAGKGAIATGGYVNGRRPSFVMKAVAASEQVVSVEDRVLKRLLEELGSRLGNFSNIASTILTVAAKTSPGMLNIQMLLEKGIIDCRFFTLLAVAGSLLSSILCFVEGCFLVLESYVEYFHVMSQHTDPGQVVHLLVKALDMFLVGTAILTFGASLHVMFVGSRTSSQRLWLPSWIGTLSVLQAKSRVGQALMMILQVEVLEKFKSVPVATGLDLACFSGAVLLSSACIFILSKISFGTLTYRDEEDSLVFLSMK